MGDASRLLVVEPLHNVRIPLQEWPTNNDSDGCTTCAYFTHQLDFVCGVGSVLHGAFCPEQKQYLLFSLGNSLHKRYVIMRHIGVDDVLVVRVHITVAEIKNLPLAGEVYGASTAIPAEIPDLVFLDELKCIVGDFFTFLVTIKGNDHANYH